MPRSFLKKNHGGKAPRSAAFTLVELLVAMAVLLMMTVLVAQLTNSATNTTTLSNKRLDADSQARLAFNRMEYDFHGMINRKDVDCFFAKNAGTGGGGNDAFYFYSEAAGYFSNSTGELSTSSFVGYRIANHKFSSASDMALYPDYVLERVGVGLKLEGQTVSTTPLRSQVTYLLLSGSLPVKDTTIPSGLSAFVGASPTWDGNFGSSTNMLNSSASIADAIFRMEFCFMVKDPSKYDGKSFVAPVAPGSTPWTNISFAGTAVNTNNMTMRQFVTNAAAVVVTIAVLDPKSRVITTPTMLAAAARALPDGDDPTVAQKWINTINSSTFKTTSTLPQVAASQVRVYQRFFYLN